MKTVPTVAVRNLVQLHGAVKAFRQLYREVDSCTMYKTVQAASQMEETIDSWCVKAAQAAAQCSETNVGRVGIQDGNLKIFFSL